MKNNNQKKGDIDNCLSRRNKKMPITKSKKEKPKNINDIKQEKIAFVLLASAKYYDIVRGTQKNTAYMRNSDICKLARITIPVKDRDIFMQFAYDKGVLLRHSRAASIEKTVGFISQDENDKVVLKLKESDFKDLAYVYMAWKNGGKGFTKCQKCGITIKQSKTKPRKYCDKCAEYEPVGRKTVICVDCGKELVVDAMASKTCRCPECQKAMDIILNREASKERMRKYREVH